MICIGLVFLPAPEIPEPLAIRLLSRMAGYCCKMTCSDLHRITTEELWTSLTFPKIERVHPVAMIPADFEVMETSGAMVVVAFLAVVQEADIDKPGFRPLNAVLKMNPKTAG